MMKILVAYAGKTGTTAKAAAALREQLILKGAEAEFCDLTAATPALEGYSAVAVGGSIRMGTLHGKAAGFIKAHQPQLLQSPFGLFCCRCGTDDTKSLLSKQFSAELLAHAAAVASFGGELDMAKQKGFDRFVVKMIQKSGQNAGMETDGLKPEAIAAFAEALVKAASRD